MLEWIAEADIVELSTPVLGELEAGFLLGSRYPENAATLAEFLLEPFVQISEVTSKVARRYGQIFVALRRAGTPLPVNDIWIAAVTMERGAHLVTFDSDFSRIDGLSYTLLH
jgi:tRNA(fMet)-specific endonuclease VapC